MFNLINQQLDIDKIYLYSRDLQEAKNQLLIDKRENTSLKHVYGSKVFIEFSNDMDDIYKNIKSTTQRRNAKY